MTALQQDKLNLDVFMIGKNIFKNITVHIDNILVNYWQPLAANVYQSSINNFIYI